MPAKRLWELGSITPGDSAEFLMYLTHRVGGNEVGLVQSDIDAIAWTSYLVEDTGETEVASGTLVVSACIFDTPLSGSAWPFGSPSGFNFAGKIPGTAFPTGDSKYMVRFTFTLNSEDEFEEWGTVPTLDVPIP